MKHLYLLSVLALYLVAGVNTEAAAASADTIHYKGVERTFYYYEPDTLLSQRPLVLLLHGYGGTATDYCPEMVNAALKAGYAVCVPQGEKDPKGSPSWNVGYPSQEGWEMDDVDYLCTLTSHLVQEHGLGAKNVFVVGMSNGGEMCYLLAHERPDFFAAFAPIAGLTMQWMKDSLTIRKPVSIMEVHGTADRISMWDGDPENTGGWGAYIPVREAVKRWADAAVSREETTEELKDSVVLHRFIRSNYEVEVLLYEVKGGDHSWSMDRLDTPAEVMAFFNRHLYTPHEGIFGTYTINDKYPEVCISVDAPEAMDPSKKTEMIFYALPNGNTNEWTAGKYTAPGDDWHFDIQHTAAQTRFLRAQNPDKNIVTVLLADRMRSWTTWRRRHADIIAETLPAIIGDVAAIYADYNPDITLSSHSGGGYFIFEYIRTAEKMDPRIKRLVFIDSVYGYESETHFEKLASWLKERQHYLCVISYEDCTVILDGKPIVSKDGGTWGRSHAMLYNLSGRFNIKCSKEGNWEIWRGQRGRITFKLLKNPEGAIYHTVLVEKNGFIDSFLCGTSKEGEGYKFWGERAYSNYISR